MSGRKLSLQADRDHNPGTEPFVPDFDTGEHSAPVIIESSEFDAGEPSVPFVPDFDDDEPSVPFVPDFDDDSQPFLALVDLGVNKPVPAAPEPKPDPKPVSSVADAEAPGPVAVPGRYLYLKWWKFVLVLFGVWSFAAVFGLSLFYWWYHTIDKTPPVFATFGYIVVCTVAGLILSMVEAKPLVAALAIAVMSAPAASVAAAAPLYGSYYCEHVTTPCVMGVLPD